MAKWGNYSQEDEQAYLATARVVHRMVKPRSPIIREYIEDPQDPDFIHVIVKRRKSNEWTSSSMIVDTHLKTWLDYDLSNGWNFENK